ncbi:methylated-DNA--[protein]-cysteine S-methyltransferase [Pseudoalteromonas sp. ASV78]|uniref:methylated-DNA--[protein]-cysteine S-methyltransferase n=1 Tax=Pseudoalteromonas sp. ASV78 TaxID=3397851 RepID=UPI0039FDB629
MTIIQTRIPSPIDDIIIQGNHHGVSYVGFYPVIEYPETPFVKVEQPHILNCAAQLNDYFAGKRTTFAVTLATQGTAFQQAVWQALSTVPFGQTQSYADIANALSNPKAVRAVGAANGKNPISIIVPCHRIIGANGKLTGYAGGLERKQWLLEHEGII